LGCAEEGWITFPTRILNQKQPKPVDLPGLRKITWKQIRTLAEKYRSLEKLLAALRPRVNDTNSNIYRTLIRAFKALQGPEGAPAECMPLLLRLGELVGHALHQKSEPRGEHGPDGTCGPNGCATAPTHGRSSGSKSISWHVGGPMAHTNKPN
jgi:hypothetical protein